MHRIDFHLHSFASNVTDYYAINTFAIPESYSDPHELHRVLKANGMSLVTLTDHNSIDGALELLAKGHADVFLSAEMTTTFPEDGCNVHITVANMTEAQFREIDRLRSNVYDMLDYVERQIAAEDRHPDGNHLAYFMTHPLMSTQNRPYGREGALTVQHIEKLLLLLPAFEVRNGTRTRSLNELTVRLLDSLDRPTIERLANEHGLAPRGSVPWRKAMLGGSDDHSGINPGRTWTEFVVGVGERPTANALVESIRRRETRPGGQHGGPVTLAHAMLKLIHDGSSRRPTGPGRSVGIGGPVGTLLELAFGPGRVRLRQKLAIGGRHWLLAMSRRVLGRRAPRRSRTFEQVLAAEAHTLLREPGLRSQLQTLATDERIFTIVSRLVNRVFAHYVGQLGRARSLDLVCAIKEVVALVSSNLFVSLPYLLSYLHQSSDRMIVRDVRKAFDIDAPPKTVLVTDTFFDVNGVAKTIQRMMAEAQRRGIHLTVVTCLDTAERTRHIVDPAVNRLVAEGRLVILEAVVNLGMPQYDGLQVRVPPFLELLKFLQEGGFTRMQISTPGPVGVAGLLAAKVLQVETSATYHTSFPEYVENYTRDISLEALAWKYMILFYHSVDEVVVPSKFIAGLLHARGLRKRKLLVLDRWVDTDRFHPRHRRDDYWQQRGISDAAAKIKFVYLGRLGVEKNLAILAGAFRKLHEENPQVHLCLIGDGPYREELARRLAGLPTTFTGFLQGDQLAQALASCDAMLFPSTTDTWGNAPLEAQASGLPVVVSDMGGPQELMQDGVTGFRVGGRDANALLRAMRALLDPGLRRRMGEAARAFTERNRIDEPFTAILDSDLFRRRAKTERRGNGHMSDDGPPDILVTRPDYSLEASHAGHHAV